MKTSKINIGTKVFNKKNQEGTITRIITKSTGYVEVAYLNGTTKKEMAFNLTDENGESLKSAPKAQVRTITTADRIQSLKNSLLKVNEHCHNTLVNAYMDALNKVEGNDFISSLIEAFAKASVGNGYISDKQAYYLAKYMVENNI